MQTSRIDTYDLDAIPWSRPLGELEAAMAETHTPEEAPRVAFGVATKEPFGATRWRFDT
jgi:hypothetical protein